MKDALVAWSGSSLLPPESRLMRGLQPRYVTFGICGSPTGCRVGLCGGLADEHQAARESRDVTDYPGQPPGSPPVQPGYTHDRWESFGNVRKTRGYLLLDPLLGAVVSVLGASVSEDLSSALK